MDYLALEQNGRIRHAALLEQQEIVEKSVDTGAGTAEVVHKTVSDPAFGIMDNMEATKDVSKLARGLHDGIADGIYATVRASDKEIGKLARELLRVKGDFDAAKRRREASKLRSQCSLGTAEAQMIAVRCSRPFMGRGQDAQN